MLKALKIKKIIAVLSVLLSLSNFSFSQCAWLSNGSTTMAAPTVPGSPLTYTPPGQNAGRRNLVVTNMIAGKTYRVSNCGSGFNSQLTIRDNTGATVVGYNDDNGPACAGVEASLDFVPPTTGTYWMQLNHFDCLANGNNPIGDLTVDLRPDYQATIISANTGAPTWCAGDTRTVDVTIQNTGALAWTDAAPDINVVLKWNTDGANWAGYYVSTDAGGLAPGATQTYSLTVDAKNATAGPTYSTNLSAGINNLTFDLVNEGSCIFSDNAGDCGPGNAAFTTPDITIVDPSPTNVPGTYTSPIVNHTDGTSQTYNFDNCISVGMLQDAAGGNVLGNTTMTTNVAASISTNPDGFAYVRRSYEVNPASDGSAYITMYFTQEDFDNYNATAVDFLSLPTSGDNADPNIPNLRLAIESGGVHTISNPLGAAGLTWNGTHWVFATTVSNLSNATFYVMTMPSCVGIGVSNLTATNVTADGVTATWSSVATIPSWGWYSIQYRVVGAPSWIDAGSANNPATSKLINNLTPNTNYEMQIRRHCSSQSEGPWSASVLFTTDVSGCASPMVFDTPTPASTSIALTWPAVSGAAWFGFEYKETSSPTWISGGTLGGTATTKTFTGLTSGVSYDFRGRTFCPSGTPSAWSVVVSATTTTPSGCDLPPVPFTSNITGYSAEIDWTPVVGAAWYEFRYKETASGTWISAGTLGGAATTKLLNGLLANTDYDFEAKTYCSNGVGSAWSTTLQFTTTAELACELPPAMSVSDVTEVSVTVTWPAVTGAGWYAFRYKESASGTWISAGTLAGASTSKTLNGLLAGTQYDLQARTYCNSNTGSNWSNTLQFTTSSAAFDGQDETARTADNNDDTAESATDILGMDEVQESLSIEIYPNPTDNLVNIRLNSEKTELIVYNSIGTIIQRRDIVNGEQVSLRDVEAGVYFFEFTTDLGKTVKRIVKK